MNKRHRRAAALAALAGLVVVSSGCIFIEVPPDYRSFYVEEGQPLFACATIDAPGDPNPAGEVRFETLESDPRVTDDHTDGLDLVQGHSQACTSLVYEQAGDYQPRISGRAFVVDHWENTSETGLMRVHVAPASTDLSVTTQPTAAPLTFQLHQDNPYFHDADALQTWTVTDSGGTTVREVTVSATRRGAGPFVFPEPVVTVPTAGRYEVHVTLGYADRDARAHAFGSFTAS